MTFESEKNYYKYIIQVQFHGICELLCFTFICATSCYLIRSSPLPGLWVLRNIIHVRHKAPFHHSEKLI